MREGITVKGGNTSETPNPELKAELGEDPERFLDRPVSIDDQWPMARINGIDSLAVVRAWKAIERKLGRDDGGPREQIMQLLEDREQYLEEHGDRADRTAGKTHDRELEPAVVTINGEPADDRRQSAKQRLAELRADDDRDATVATDGGEDDVE
jgi:hypothetical protein